MATINQPVDSLEQESQAIKLAEIERFIKIFINELATNITFNNSQAQDLWDANKMARKQMELERRVQEHGVSAYVITTINDTKYITIPDSVFAWLMDPNETLMGISYFTKPFKGTFANMFYYEQYGYWAIGGANILQKRGGVARNAGNGKVEIMTGPNYLQYETVENVDAIPAILVRGVTGSRTDSVAFSAETYLELARRMITKKIEFIESNGTKILINRDSFKNEKAYEEFLRTLKLRDTVLGIKASNEPINQLVAPLTSSINATDISESINFFLKRAAELCLLPEFNQGNKGTAQLNDTEVMLSMTQKLRNLDVMATFRERDIEKLMIDILGAPETTVCEIQHTTIEDLQALAGGLKDNTEVDTKDKSESGEV